MPDAIEQLRTATERDLANLIGKLSPSHRRRIRDAIEVYGSARAIPEDVWESIRQDIDEPAAALMLLLLMGSYSEQSKRAAKVAGIAPATTDEEALKRQAAGPAAALARQVADEYVSGVRSKLETEVDAKADEINSLPPKERARSVKQAIDNAVGEDAAETTIVTNTTRGITAGQGSAGDDIGRMANVTMTVVWRTERDAKVCPICRPLDGNPIDRWEAVLDANTVSADTRAMIVSQLGPPAHPNCRCRTEHVVMDRGDN